MIAANNQDSHFELLLPSTANPLPYFLTPPSMPCTRRGPTGQIEVYPAVSSAHYTAWMNIHGVDHPIIQTQGMTDFLLRVLPSVLPISNVFPMGRFIEC